MKLALLSDIHANIRALDACLGHARQQGAQGFALLGDFVGYGAEPDQVVDRVMALSTAGAFVIKGNHDDLATRPLGREPQTMDERTAAWTHDRLSAGQRQFLVALPLTATHETALLVHANADVPTRWRYVTQAPIAQASLDAAGPAVRHVFVGHVHRQSVYYRGATGGLMTFAPGPARAVPVPTHRQWLLTVGSVGQPRDGDPRAMYALWDSQAQQVWFHRVTYDHLGAARAVREAGLGDDLAKRLEEGK